ncbi:unnamed protein product [Gadus morhua 'NCC']
MLNLTSQQGASIIHVLQASLKKKTDFKISRTTGICKPLADGNSLACQRRAILLLVSFVHNKQLLENVTDTIGDAPKSPADLLHRYNA